MRSRADRVLFVAWTTAAIVDQATQSELERAKPSLSPEFCCEGSRQVVERAVGVTVGLGPCECRIQHRLAHSISLLFRNDIRLEEVDAVIRCDNG